jgi:hypothetical protein
MLFRTALLEFEVNTRRLLRPWTGGNVYCRVAEREAWVEWYPGRRKRPQVGLGSANANPPRVPAEPAGRG